MGILNAFRKLLRSSGKVERAAVYQPQPDPRPLVYGSHGRLEIPSLYISVPLYNAMNGAERQRVVDSQNSAAYFDFGSQGVIADHASQANFQNLNMARAGMIATIDERYRQTSYQLVQSQVGHIRISPLGNRLFDQNWNQVAGQNEGGLCIYTCIGKSAEDVMDVRLTYWQPVNTAGDAAMKNNGGDTGVSSNDS